MKVLLYLNTLSRFNYGNLMSNLELMKGFLEKGVEVLFAVNRKTPDDVEVPVEVVPLNARGDLDRPLKLREVVKRFSPDVVIANMLTQITTASFAKKLLGSTGTKFIGIERDTRPWHRRIWKIPYRVFMKRVYEGMDHIVAVSPAVERDLRRTFFLNSSMIKVIYDPVDIDRIRSMATEPVEREMEEIFGERDVLVCVGRLDRQKEPLLALEVFRRVKERNSNVCLCFVGSGELEGPLRERIRIYGLKDDVVITGFRENPYAYMKRAKLLLHTASREGLGRVILEGMSLGLPVVAFYNEESGYREVVEEAGCGLLVPFGDIEGMAEGVIKLLRDRESYRDLSDRALRASERFRRERIVEELINLLR